MKKSKKQLIKHGGIAGIYYIGFTILIIIFAPIIMNFSEVISPTKPNTLGRYLNTREDLFIFLVVFLQIASGLIILLEIYINYKYSVDISELENKENLAKGHEHKGIIEFHWGGIIRARCLECGEIIYLDSDQIKKIIK